MKKVIEHITESACRQFGVTLVSLRHEAGALIVIIDHPLVERDRCKRLGLEIHKWYPDDFDSVKVYNVSDKPDWSKGVKR